MSMKMAWIGCGTHATEMLLAQLLRHDVQVTALCDIEPARLASAGRQFGVSKLYTDALDMIANSGVDAVGMAVGPEQHLAFGKAALQRGLPVFMEKPPSGSAAGAKELLSASEKSGKPLLLGFMKRYSIGNRMAHTIVQSGEFGDVLGLTGYYMTAPGYFAGNVDYTGFFLHHCVHYMDLVSHLVSSPVSSMSARKIEKVPGRVLFHVNLDFDNGALGSIAMGTIQSRGAPVERLELMSDHQRLEVENIIDLRWHRDPKFKTNDPAARLHNDVDTLSWRPNFTAAANEDFKGYHALLSDVVPALQGHTTLAPDIHAGVIAMERLEQLRKILNL